MTESELMRAYVTGQLSKQQYNDEMTKLVSQNAGGLIPGSGMVMGSLQKTGGLKAANGALSELIQMLKSGKQLDPQLLKTALKEITRLGGKPLGQKNLQRAIGYEVQASPSLSTLQQSIGKFNTPQQLGFATGARSTQSAAGGIGQGLAGLGGKLPPPPVLSGSGLGSVGGALRSGAAGPGARMAASAAGSGGGQLSALKQLLGNRPLVRSAMAGAGLIAGLALSGRPEQADESGDIEAQLAALQGLGLKPQRSNTVGPPSFKRTSGPAKRRPGISELAPKTTNGMSEEVGEKFDSTPEALEFIHGRNMTEGIPMFEGQTSSLGVLGDTSLQHTMKSGKNKNLLKSILKGLW